MTNNSHLKQDLNSPISTFWETCETYSLEMSFLSTGHITVLIAMSYLPILHCQW
uniref:Uncharacterized protein n=1 Tax=Anguilla anguilla TaxID=7936 RepID=A0A0E9PAM3_ANGAN